MTPQDFLGRWDVSRDIDDKVSGQGRFEGTAEVSQGARHWVYSETGHMILPDGQRFVAQRQYVWQPSPDGSVIETFFEDGRDFHTIPLKGGETGHWCDPDQYDVSYDFDSWPLWTSVWSVKGPRKDYSMRTVYRASSLAVAAT